MTATPRSARRLPVVLRNRAFGAVWAAQVLTQAANRMFQVGAVWWLVGYAIGGDQGLASGAFLAVSTLPAVALAPLVARVIARYPHREVLRVSAAVAGVVAAGVAGWAHLHALPLVTAYAAALVLAACQALFDPCLTTSVPELVDDADIEAATGFELATQSLAGLAGGLLGPLVVDAGGFPAVLAGCAGAYLAAAGVLGLARFAAAPEEAADGQATAARRTLRQVLGGRPLIRYVLWCLTAANLFTTAVYVVMPLYTRSVLHSDGSTVATFESALGIGALVGSFTGRLLPGGPATTGGACLVAMAAALGVPGAVADQAVVAACLVVAGWCVGAIGVRFVALFQRLVPTADKPVFFAAMQALLGATFPVSSLVFGLLGDHLSPRSLCLLQAAGLVPAALALCWLGGRSQHESVADDGLDEPLEAAAAMAGDQ
ncbi:MFS transporter [Streptantibioticus ferralitis]|uniref:MFS transporter n=1 Tax=Streptantibioticus ferralitis TaxID=236510 RepID=A0ABT5YTR4_9ACTN|nr:MFS transporter [Streptantibioticus ferralitis]MDF2254829.1 MFS transporter [Streptantibioticus ferralitis]